MKCQIAALLNLQNWADYHAKKVPNPMWKRAYALIREGADLLLRRRALAKEDSPVEPEKYVALEQIPMPNFKNTNGPPHFQYQER